MTYAPLQNIASNELHWTLEAELYVNGKWIHSAEKQVFTATPFTSDSKVYGYNTQKDRLLSAGSLSYSYDNEGQLVSSGGTCLTFDHNHSLVEIGSDTAFSYDGRGNRLSATRSGVTTHYVYDPWGNLLAEADASNNITRKYIYGKGLLAMATNSARYFYHFNGNGNTTALSDINQNILNSYAYDPFGSVLNQQEAIAQPFKFVGQYGVMAEPNGLYYMRARYYDPTVGRFISEDPLGFGDVGLYAYFNSIGKPLKGDSLSAYAALSGNFNLETNPYDYTDNVRRSPIGANSLTHMDVVTASFASMNLYIYASDNPINWIDPLGLFTVPCQTQKFYCQRVCVAACFASFVEETGPFVMPPCMISCKIACDSAFPCNKKPCN